MNVYVGLLAAYLLAAMPVGAAGAPPAGFYAHGPTVWRVIGEVYGAPYRHPRQLAQIHVESRYVRTARSWAGAEGIAQVMPATRRGLEREFGRTFDPFDVGDAAFMYSVLMKRGAIQCARNGFRGVEVFRCAEKLYNGGGLFWREHARAGRPATVAAVEPYCIRRASACRENREYWRRIEQATPMYLVAVAAL